jgi:protein-S-isoprenylcysteine O-methyltransferase Ste14
MGGHMCHKCHGIFKLVLGLLLLLNAFVWPLWLGIDGWVSWFGVLFVLMGLVKLLVPNKCKSCNAMQKK